VTSGGIQIEKEWRKYHINTYTPPVHDGIFTFMDCPDRKQYGNFICCEQTTKKYNSITCKALREDFKCPRGFKE